MEARTTFTCLGELEMACRACESQLLFIEPFYGGSHRQLADMLLSEFGGDLYSLPARKWHWRMRVSALYFAQTIQRKDTYKTLFASSVLNLCELVSLRPDLSHLHKVLYFHENQLVYPVRKQKERDFQHGYNQILSCLVADVVLFNSYFNMTSFLETIDSYLNFIPDHKPQGISEQLRPKCSVLYFPLQLPFPLKHGEGETHLHSKLEVASEIQDTIFETENITALGSPSVQHKNEQCDASATIYTRNNDTDRLGSSQKSDSLQVVETVLNFCGVDTSISKQRTSPLHIVWPHRWEHDKGPEEFCCVLTKMINASLNFVVSILGEHTNDIPECFKALFPKLGPRLLHQGYVPRDIYWKVLKCADVVVSTAKHEFFGIAMLEAVFCGCYPLCPNTLVYPEIYPGECLYSTEQQLFKRLESFCKRPHTAKDVEIIKQVRVSQFLWTTLKEQFRYHLRN